MEQKQNSKPAKQVHIGQNQWAETTKSKQKDTKQETTMTGSTEIYKAILQRSNSSREAKQG